jgi:hypothetical protein
MQRSCCPHQQKPTLYAGVGGASHAFIPMYTAAAAPCQQASTAKPAVVHAADIIPLPVPSAAACSKLTGTAALCQGARLLRQEPSTYTTTKGQTPKGFYAIADKAEAGASGSSKGVRYAAGGCCTYCAYHQMSRERLLKSRACTLHNGDFNVVCKQLQGFTAQCRPASCVIMPAMCSITSRTCPHAALC